MLIEETIQKMLELRMHGMAKATRELLESPPFGSFAYTRLPLPPHAGPLSFKTTAITSSEIEARRVQSV